MERRTFLRNSLLTAGGVLLGGSAIFRFMKDSKQEEDPPRPATIEKICQGNGKNVLVLMSAGTRQYRPSDRCLYQGTFRERTHCDQSISG